MGKGAFQTCEIWKTHRVRFPLDILVPLERFIVRDSFRVTRKARYRRRKERGFDRSSCSLRPRRVNAPATIAARAPTWPASTSVDTSCRKPHLRRYTRDGIQTARRVYIQAHARRRRIARRSWILRGSRLPIADRTRWNLTRSALARVHHKNQSAFKQRRGKPRGETRAESLSGDSTMVLVNELRNDSAIVKRR